MNRFLAICLTSALATGPATASKADVTEACIAAMVQVTAWKSEVLEGQQVARYELEIINNTSIDISGVIIEHELWADDRPTALATGYSQSAHTLGGGLLAGETTRFPEYIPLSAHAANIAETANDVSVRLKIQNIADLQKRPVGAEADPFALWNAERSDIRCSPFRKTD